MAAHAGRLAPATSPPAASDTAASAPQLSAARSPSPPGNSGSDWAANPAPCGRACCAARRTDRHEGARLSRRSSCGASLSRRCGPLSCQATADRRERLEPKHVELSRLVAVANAADQVRRRRGYTPRSSTPRRSSSSSRNVSPSSTISVGLGHPSAERSRRADPAGGYRAGYEAVSRLHSRDLPQRLVGLVIVKRGATWATCDSQAQPTHSAVAFRPASPRITCVVSAATMSSRTAAMLTGSATARPSRTRSSCPGLSR